MRLLVSNPQKKMQNTDGRISIIWNAQINHQNNSQVRQLSPNSQIICQTVSKVLISTTLTVSVLHICLFCSICDVLVEIFNCNWYCNIVDSSWYVKHVPDVVWSFLFSWKFNYNILKCNYNMSMMNLSEVHLVFQNSDLDKSHNNQFWQSSTERICLRV